ncbi:MAG: ADP-ribosylation factor-like protein [Promethearchaeota archaeon]
MVENKLIVFGLSSAGKTSLSKYIKEETNTINEKEKEHETFDINKMIIDSVEVLIYDIPGDLPFMNSEGPLNIPENIIFLFVLDTADSARFGQAKKELDKVINNLNLRGLPLIVCFHKMDLESARNNYTKARGILKLPLIEQREVFWFKTSIITGKGIAKLKAKLVELIEKSRW